MNESTPRTLTGEFNYAEQLYQKLNQAEVDTNDFNFQGQLNEALTSLDLCSTLMRQLALFNTNESAVELSTTTLRLLLLDAYRGELIQKRADKDRETLLLTAKDCLENFLKLCGDYGLLDVEDIKRWKIFEEKEETPPRQVSREEKIARYKREKAAKDKVEALQRTLERGEEALDDDDLARDHVLALVDYHVKQALDDLDVILAELILVREMKKRTTTEVKIDVNDQVEMAPPKRAEGPLLSSSGKVLRTFVITGKRDELKAQVFQPGWRLPTMTVDEYLQREYERGNIISNDRTSQKKEKGEDEDDMEKEDEKTYKAREWDEFKDANPRGAGNRTGKG